jgi:hypothetical protein
MTDLTTRPTEHGTGPALAPVLEPVPVNGAALGDRRTLRQASRAEQERLSADAEVERRARAARLELELREQRRAAARRERQADQQERRVRVEQRRARRAARHARLRAAAPRWADRALFILPILMPMAVAWVGQIRFAMTVMHWPLAAAVVFAAGFELSTAYAARLDWLARAAGDSGLLFRGATWGFAAGAALMNYWHAAGPDFAPTGEAVSYGLMSITGVVLWELLSTYRHRTALRAEGKLPAARPRYGLARWIWFRPLTRLASLLALRDGYTTTDLAWQAALTAVDLYGSARAARKAVRAGRPVPRPEPLDVDDPEDDDVHQRDITAREEDLRDVQTRHTHPGITLRYVQRDGLARDTERDTRARHGDRDVTEQYVERDTAPPGDQADVTAEIAAPARETTGERDDLDQAAPIGPAHVVEQSTTPRDDLCDLPRDHGETTVNRGEVQGQDDAAAEDHESPVTHWPADQDDDRDAVAPTGNGDRPGELPSSGKGAVIARMRTYARECAAQGRSITGADLDRQFGTRDYGRKVLRQLAAESTQPT